MYFAAPVVDTLVRTGSEALLTPYTGWTTSTSLVVTVLSWAVSTRDGARWWWPSATGSGVLAVWTVAAWLDGVHSTRALRDGLPSQTWFAWPGDGTPLHQGDLTAVPTWSLDLLSATGPAVVALAIWAGPLLLRSFGSPAWAGRPRVGLREPSRDHRLGADVIGVHPRAVLSGSAVVRTAQVTSTPSPRTVLAREVDRATHVAAAVVVLLCGGVVLLQAAGGIYFVSSPLGAPGWPVLLDPGFLVVVGTLVAAWVLGSPPALSGGVSSAWKGAVVVLLLAVAVASYLVHLDTDLLVLVAGACGVLVASTRTIVSTRALQLLVGGDIGSADLCGDQDQHLALGDGAAPHPPISETGVAHVAAPDCAAPTTKPPSESVAP